LNAAFALRLTITLTRSPYPYLAATPFAWSVARSCQSTVLSNALTTNHHTKSHQKTYQLTIKCLLACQCKL